MSIGQIVQVIGAVVDIEFPRDAMPKVYDALVLEQDENNTLAEAGRALAYDEDGALRQSFTTTLRTAWREGAIAALQTPEAAGDAADNGQE